ncbi:MAG: excinuclease ABC subunit UvrC [Deltaproteobacteria bacterium]|nr:MAG: excinuclease ABC subunit UvrC [Deltaproteobacteria bacterium]
MPSPLDEKAAQLPTTSGCYLFKDGRGRVIYVGKAINLRARVRQYLSFSDERVMVPHLVAAARDVEVVVTHTEKEALLLENTLIKKHKPRFNTELRDDKNFLHLRLDPREPWPWYRLVRNIKDDGARYFGPYASASKARATLAFVQKSFPLRTCTDAVLRSRTRPCLLAQMGRCTAPCVDAIAREAYMEDVESSMLFLEGRNRPLIRRLQKRMQEAAEELEFERAARFRDLIASVEMTIERQQVVDARLEDRDVWGLFREGARGAIAVIPVREGMMGQPRTTVLDGLVGSDAEELSSLINRAYREGTPLPPEILVPTELSDAEALEEVLSERLGKKVRLRVPKRGGKTRLVALAVENARVGYLAEHDEEARRQAALEALAEVIGLPLPPHRMECFDNSHLGGVNPVAAMAVFLDGEPARKEYRRYKVKTAQGNDDYAMMREIIERRFRRAIEEGNRPDLLVIDGGKGQLGVARAVLADLGLDDQPVIGIAKPRTERKRGDRETPDKLVLPNAKDPITLRADHPGLRLVQYLRDETHRHAVRYQRQVRQRASLTSVLEHIPGVGPARKKALLRTLGSAAAVADADVETLAAVPGVGPALAQVIYDTFRPDLDADLG